MRGWCPQGRGGSSPPSDTYANPTRQVDREGGLTDGGVEADREFGRLEDCLLLGCGEPVGHRDQAAEPVEEVTDRLRVETADPSLGGCDDGLGPVPFLTVATESLFDFAKGERTVLDSIGQAGNPGL